MESQTQKRRPRAHQLLIQSMDDRYQNPIKINNKRQMDEMKQPNKDVTRLLVNPEQALKKNLKPIMTAYPKERPPLRSLFSVSTRNAHKLNMSFQSTTRQ